MSGYLQRLFDRAAALPVTGSGGAGVPAMLPGSPLARIDQRLGVAGLAADFTFGTGSEEELPADDAAQGLPDLPLPAAAPQPLPKTGKIGLAAGDPGSPIPFAERHSHSPSASSSSLPQTAPLPAQPVRGPADAGSQPEAVPDAKRDLPSPITERIIERQRTFVPAEPKLGALSEQAGESQNQRKATQPRQPAQPVSRRPEAVPQNGPHPFDTPQTAIVRPAVEPVAGRSPQERVAEPRRPAEAVPQPTQPTVQESVLPEVTDWREIDRRITAELDRRLAAQKRADTEKPGGPVGEQPDRAEQDRAPAVMKSAAESSMIGPIEQTTRPRMLFGERLR